MSRTNPYEDWVLGKKATRIRFNLKAKAMRKIVVLRDTNPKRKFGFRKRPPLDRSVFTNKPLTARFKGNADGANILRLITVYAKQGYTMEQVTKVMRLTLEHVQWYDSEYKIFNNLKK